MPYRACRQATDQRPHVSEQLEGPDFLPPGGRCGRAHPFCWLALLSASVALREGLARRRLAEPSSGALQLLCTIQLSVGIATCHWPIWREASQTSNSVKMHHHACFAWCIVAAGD